MRALAKEFDGKIRERIAKFKDGTGMGLTPPDSVEGQGSENIDPRLRGPESGSVLPTPDTMSSFLANDVYERGTWPSTTSPSSQGLWDSIMGGIEQNEVAR